MRRPLLALTLLACVSGCGLLFPPDPLDFRPYTLKGVEYEEAVSLVQSVIVAEFQARFGQGFQTDWDPDQGNFKVDGVRDGYRTLELYVKLVPRGDDTVVEMFAVVRHLDPGAVAGQPYVNPMQDVHLEEVLYDAMVVAALDMRAPDT